MGDQLESELVEDLLFLLSPFTLVKPAQWVLQFLVTKYKVIITFVIGRGSNDIMFCFKILKGNFAN